MVAGFLYQVPSLTLWFVTLVLTDTIPTWQEIHVLFQFYPKLFIMLKPTSHLFGWLLFQKQNRMLQVLARMRRNRDLVHGCREHKTVENSLQVPQKTTRELRDPAMPRLGRRPEERRAGP